MTKGGLRSVKGSDNTPYIVVEFFWKQLKLVTSILAG